MLVVTSDRGLAGAYSSNALKTAEGLYETLRSEGKESMIYVIGRKGAGYYRFRNRPVEEDFTGFSEQPDYESASAAADALIERFVQDTDEGGVDEIHIVFTEFASMLSQRAVARRILPMVIEETSEQPEGGPLPLYEFEPSAESVLDALLPRYVISRVFAATARVGRLGVRRSPAGHEVRHGQRGRPHQVAHPSGQLGPSGRDHPRDQ